MFKDIAKPLIRGFPNLVSSEPNQNRFNAIIVSLTILNLFEKAKRFPHCANDV